MLASSWSGSKKNSKEIELKPEMALSQVVDSSLSLNAGIDIVEAVVYTYLVIMSAMLAPKVDVPL